MGPALKASAALVLLLLPPSALAAKKQRTAAKTERSTAPAAGLPRVAPSTAPITVESVLARFQEFEKGLESLAMDFKQIVRWEQSGLAQSVEGSLEFRKPDLLRLEHRLPERQTVVADGTWLWIWRRSTNQVIQTNLESWRRSEPLARALLDFDGYADLLRRYEVSVATVSPPEPSGHRRAELVLRPKEDPDSFRVVFKLSTEDYFPADTELQVEGVKVRSRYSAIRYNPPLPEERFRFEPPDDADVFQSLGPRRTR